MAKTILILAANPKDTPRLRLDQEVREIANGLQRAKGREEFALEQQWAARPADARRAMLDFRPNIVHFCGHGAGEDGVAFEDETGQTRLVSARALSGFFELFADQVECVLLNACYSEIQAEAIAEHINYVIGIRKGIEDAIAIEFAVAFYDALGARETIEFAYKLACNAIQWTGIPKHLMPVLKVKRTNVEKLDCIVLCGGYSVRLWPLTTDISKVLLPIAGKPVLGYVLDFAQYSPAINTIIVSVNQRFAKQIHEYLDSYQATTQRNHPIEVVVEPTSQEREKLGPVGALDYIVAQSSPRDILVLGGDNIFGFRLHEFLQFSASAAEPCSYNAVFDYQTQNDLTEYGTVSIDPAGIFLEFREKPRRVVFKKISTACYLFREWDVAAIHRYIENGEDPDSLGALIHWLLVDRHSRIGSFLFSSFWFDIGTRETLLNANRHFLQHSLSGELTNTTWNEPVHVAEGAQVVDSKLGPDVYIGAGVRVVDSDIENSIIMEQCIIRRSVIKNSAIGSGSVIEGQILDTVCGRNSKFAM